MYSQKDTGVAAILEHLIEHGTNDLATVFARAFEMAMRIERERFFGAGHYERPHIMVMPMAASPIRGLWLCPAQDVDKTLLPLQPVGHIVQRGTSLREDFCEIRII